ncbi:hypothetical protein ABIF63_005765 [Bradyrhizobium japonicum]|uniref:Integrase n=1 Tax=Bradyrhizobium japonicum TaxID=375 RepID=A0ABV2RZP2_BRAJP|nr:hypothetical protein [Bradyrhizobium japonicum]UQD95246.1 hypothetical protein JEY30_26880 [Bradyrhizobium japonicum]WLB23443.1 hypothetical protein QIH95_22385 [Bradyrhizobium japonicum]
MTHEDHRESGKSHLEYFRELLERDGDKATVSLHADQLKSLLAFASPDKR